MAIRFKSSSRQHNSMHMRILKLAIWQNGILRFQQTFCQDLTVISGKYRALAGEIIRIVAGCNITVKFAGDLRFLAELTLDEELRMQGHKAASSEKWDISVCSIASGKDHTQSYFAGLQSCPEEDDLMCFSGQKRQDYPRRLLRYKQFDLCYSQREFAARTRYIGSTTCFRKCLNAYIQNFEPVLLRQGKAYQLVLEPEGSFRVLHPGIADQVFLSETENVLYQWLCYFYITEFWAEVESIRDIHHVKRPLLAADFLERLDESVDVQPILKSMKNIDRQVILIAWDSFTL